MSGSSAGAEGAFYTPGHRYQNICMGFSSCLHLPARSAWPRASCSPEPCALGRGTTSQGGQRSLRTPRQRGQMNRLPNRLPRRLQRDLGNFTMLLQGGGWINAPSVCEGLGSGTAEQLPEQLHLLPFRWATATLPAAGTARRKHGTGLPASSSVHNATRPPRGCPLPSASLRWGTGRHLPPPSQRKATWGLCLVGSGTQRRGKAHGGPSRWTLSQADVLY